MDDRIPEGYQQVDMEPLVPKIEYEIFEAGREVVFLGTKRLTGSNGKAYDYHIVQNDRGATRGLFGCAQLTSKLRRAGSGARVWLRYDGKTTAGRKGTEHTWTVAVRGNSLVAPLGTGEPESF